MGTVKDFKNITNWDELFDMVIKTTHDVIKNAGYNYSYDEVEKQYYSGF